MNMKINVLARRITACMVNYEYENQCVSTQNYSVHGMQPSGCEYGVGSASES